MAKNKKKVLPKFNSLDELVIFFETHDMSPYEKSMREVPVDVDPKPSNLQLNIDPQLSRKIFKIARSKRVSSSQLLNSWIRKKIAEERRTV